MADIRGQVTWSEKTALCVVMATKGYPGSYPKNTPISKLDATHEVKDLTVFHAGTAQKDGQLVSTGGRVLGVTALGETIEEAQRRAYMGVDMIEWPEGFCRRDIGWRALKAEKAA